MNGITNYILLITLLIYGSRAPAQNVKQEIDSVTMNKPFYMAIRTNMIYDALLIPNVGMEFDLGKRWTVAANAMYGWWNNDRSHWYWRAYGGDVAVRKWLGKAARRKALTGHHVGCTARYSPTISKPVDGATWAASPVARSGTR